MHIKLTGVQNEEPFPLTRALPFEPQLVALCELTYYHRWYNISTKLQNNAVSNGHTTYIPDGYYNVCDLNVDVFLSLDTELHLHTPTGLLQLSVKKRLVLNRGLANLLGFTRVKFAPASKTYIADEPHHLTVYREICMHLSEISTSENLHNGRPSTVLRSVPVENEKCGSGRTETFSVLHYKRLVLGAIPELTLTILDADGKKVLII